MTTTTKNFLAMVAMVGVVATLVILQRPSAPAADPFRLAVLDYHAGRAKTAKPRFEEFVLNNAGSPNKQVQDKVTAARLHLAYLDAKAKQYDKASAAFRQAAKGHKGTDAVEPGYGTLTDQAEYQAAVCLAAAGQKAEALAAFRTFIKSKPTSGLIHAAYRRVEQIAGHNEEDAALLQASVTRQEEIARKELAMCGPKSAAYMIHKLTGREVPYPDLAKTANATESGTTMIGLKQALGTHDVSTVGLELSAIAFRRLKLPAIWLTDQHFVVLTSIFQQEVEVFDPLIANYRRIPLPRSTDTNFKATVLALEPPRENPS